MREIDANVKAVNPNCKTIAEIYPGIEESAVRVGSDVYDMYQVVDTIAHEYSTGGMSASRTPLSWFQDMIGMYSFRAFAGSKPSWMLSYSWEKEKRIAPGEAMKNLAMAQLMAGTNTWDAQGHVMSGSNDLETRKLIFGWIKDHEKTFFLPRQPVYPVGVYFSPKTRDYFADEYIDSFRGMLLLLMQSHVEFQIVTPRTLKSFPGGRMLIVPEARCLSNVELALLQSLHVITTGQGGAYDETGAVRASNPLWSNYPHCPGKAYYAALKREFNQAAAGGKWEGTEFDHLRKTFLRDMVNLGYTSRVEIEAPPFVTTQIASVDGKVAVFLANFAGLKSKEIAQQIPAQNMKITFSTDAPHIITLLPFLGEPLKIEGRFHDGKLSCEIPSIEKGAVVWVE